MVLKIRRVIIYYIEILKAQTYFYLFLGLNEKCNILNTLYVCHTNVVNRRRGSINKTGGRLHYLISGWILLAAFKTINLLQYQYTQMTSWLKPFYRHQLYNALKSMRETLEDLLYVQPELYAVLAAFKLQIECNAFFFL